MRSKLYTLAGKKHPDVDFYVVNGISNGKNDALAFGKLVQHELNVMHNNRHGLLDIIDFGVEKLGFFSGACYDRRKETYVNLCEEPYQEALKKVKGFYYMRDNE